jgi:hypothetical protein
MQKFSLEQSKIKWMIDDDCFEDGAFCNFLAVNDWTRDGKAYPDTDLTQEEVDEYIQDKEENPDEDEDNDDEEENEEEDS